MYRVLIREVRESKGLSQVKLAELSGVSQSWISDLENGKGIPDLKILGLLARPLNVKIKDLFVED